MLIDPLTVFAQIFNFVILVALLKRFLYGPILRAMKQREHFINGQLQKAAEKQAIAQEEAERYRQCQQDFERQRKTLEAQAHQEAEQYRQAQLEQARIERDQQKLKWTDAVQQEQNTFLRILRQQAGVQIARTLRFVLEDLAQASLEQQILEVFMKRLEQLPAPEQQLLKHALNTSRNQPLIIESAFPLSEASQSRLKATLSGKLPTPQTQSLQIKFEQRPTAICGVELSLPGYKLAWSIDHYLQTFEENLIRVLESQITGLQTSISVGTN